MHIDRLDWTLFSVVIFFHHWFPLLKKKKLRTGLLVCPTLPRGFAHFCGAGRGGEPPLPTVRDRAGTPDHTWFRPFLFKNEPKMAHFWFGLLSESGFANSGYFSLASEVVTHPPTSQVFTCVCGEIFLTACLCKQSVLMCTPRVYLRDAGRHLERAGVKKTQDPHSASPTTPPSSLCKIDHAHFLIIGILCKLSLFKEAII